MSQSTPEPPVDPLDRGLAVAFERAARPSALDTLSRRTRSQLGLHLPPAEGQQRPLVRRAEDAPENLRSARYLILGQIARGGVGLVYQARDLDLGRDVAMKVLRPEYQDHAEVVQRFVEEAQIGGQLEHPGIVPVYEFGLQHGEQPFFAMKLVQGKTLAGLLTERTQLEAERPRYLRIFAQVCQTVAYAHARHVVHRDLKPSNVMIGSFGEVQVVDWGFAKVLLTGGIEDERAASSRAPEAPRIATIRTQPGSDHSLAGSVFGTPEYMPPEQARGEVERMDERSDVFSLGAILCEILTGLPPYAAVDGDVLDQARGGDTARALARLARCGAARELEELAAQCLAVDPAARPKSARQIAECVEGYLTAAEERTRSVRMRLRTTVAVTSTVIVGLVIAAIAFERTRASAEERRTRAAGLVNDALQETQTLRGRALERNDDAAAWDEALSTARRAAALSAAPDVPAELHDSATSALRAVEEGADGARLAREQAAREQAMVARLLELRLPPDDDLDHTAWVLNESVRLANAYSSAFSDYGIDVDATLDPASFGRAQAAIALPLAAALDHWGLELRRLVLNGRTERLGIPNRAQVLEQARRRHELAAALDHGDDWRDRLRAAFSAEVLDLETLRGLATTAPIERQPMLCLLTLAEALALLDVLEDATTFLRRVQTVHPGDFVLALRLGVMLESQGPGHSEEAFALYRIAHALRPDGKQTRHRAAQALRRAGDSERAAQLLEQLAAEEPRYRWFTEAGAARDDLRQWPAAARLFREALACPPHPGDPQKHQARYGLARVLAFSGEFDTAIDLLRAILAENPERPAPGHWVLGWALYAKAERRGLPQGKELLEDPLVKEALANYHKCLDLDPGQLDAHHNIGNALLNAGEWEAAIVEYHKELEHHPEHVDVRNNLGLCLENLGRYEEAAVVLQELVDRAPSHVTGLNNLGRVLDKLGRYEEAAAALRKALNLSPDRARAHENLALVHAHRGEWAETVSEWELALQLDPERTYYQESLEWAREQRAKSLDWSALVEGRASLTEASAVELSAAAYFAYVRRRFARSVELYGAAFERGREELPPSDLYDAACSAVLAASGAGVDARDLDDDARGRLRSTALAWLEARLELWQTHEDREAVRSGLEHWLEDKDLSSVRGLEALRQLPGDEATRWSALWSDVIASLAALRDD